MLSWLLLEGVSSGEERHFYQQANENVTLEKPSDAQHHIQECIILSLVKTLDRDELCPTEITNLKVRNNVQKQRMEISGN
ncbi:hypothetical protein TURU_088972 [Turdus rufiventris]|nr:hypothetical protein TURU_088972 [Turdus rufiventris]